MTAKKILLITISATAVFAAFLGIKTIFAIGPGSCGVGDNACATLQTDGAGNFGVSISSDGSSRLFIKSADTSTTKNGLKIVSSDGSTPVFVVRNDGLVTLASSTSFANAGLVFPDGSKQVVAFTGAASSISAGNVSAGSFGSNVGGGNFSFPASVGIGTVSLQPGYKLTTAGGIFVNATSSGQAIYVNAVNSDGGYLGAGGIVSNAEFGLYGSNDEVIAIYDSENRKFHYGYSAIVIDPGNNYVGIGTSAPQYPLDVYGASNKLGLSYSYTATYGSTGGELSADSTGNLHIIATKRFPAVVASNILLAENGGKVGIATTTPTYPLTVAGVIHSSTGGYRFPDGTTQTTAASGSGGGLSTSTPFSAGYIPFATSTSALTNSAIFQSGGNIGIGTTSPGQKLEVSGGNAKFSGSVQSNGFSLENSNMVFGSGAYNFYKPYMSSPSVSSEISTAKSLYINIDANNDDTTSTIIFGHSGAGSSATKIMTLQENGNVAIGTDTAYARLHVNGGDVYILNNNGNPRFLIGDGTSGGNWGGFTWNSAGDYVSIGTDTGGMTTLNILETGNVGIGTVSPAQKLSVSGNIQIASSTAGLIFGDGTTQTTAATAGVSLSGTNTWTATNYFRSAAGSGATILTSNAWNLQSYSIDGGAAAMSFHRSGAYAVNMGLNPDNSFAIGGWSDGAATRISIAANGNTTFGTGASKINVGTVDPPYTINGEQYATYLSGMTGQKEETTGEIRVTCNAQRVTCETSIDFGTQEKGSDLWLFAKTANIKNNFDKLTVLLTPAFDGKVWYEKDTENNVLKVFAIPATSYTLQDTSFSVSYRLTAPRFDSAKWLNTRNEPGVDGFIIND